MGSTRPKVIRVLLVDDHDMVRAGLKVVLSIAPDILVVGEAENGQVAVDCCHTLHPTVVLLDLMMPVMDGFEATQIIHELYPEIRILILTSSGDYEHIERVLQAGATACIIKTVRADELIDAVYALYP